MSILGFPGFCEAIFAIGPFQTFEKYGVRRVFMMLTYAGCRFRTSAECSIPLVAMPFRSNELQAPRLFEELDICINAARG